jgi:lipopolysaccharide export system permease protein
MNILSQYVLKKFLFYFFIILISLELFFVLTDLFRAIKWLPDSANLQFLYISYYAFFVLTITLPLSLIFGWITTIINLIKQNELVAFFSLGYSYKDIFKSVVLTSSLIATILLILQATPLAYSEEQKNKIKDGEYFSNYKKNLLLKYDNYFVYMQKLEPALKTATNIKILELFNNNDVLRTIEAKKGYYKDNKWYLVDVKITQKPLELNWEDSKIVVSHEKFVYMLNGFKPKILNNVYESKSQYSIIDAIETFILLYSQGLNTAKIRTTLYFKFISTFFVIPLLIIIFIFAPINSRFFSVAKFSSIAIFLSLVAWGSLFLLYKLSLGGVFVPELGLVLPFLLIFYLNYYLYKKKTI